MVCPVHSPMGLCSLGNNDTKNRMTVVCKYGPNKYKKHFLGLSDNVSFFAEQLDDMPVNVFNYRIIFKPESLFPASQLKMKGSQ